MMQVLLKNKTLTCHLRVMQEEDVPQVSDIDRTVFPTMRPLINYHNELENKLAHYLVACSDERVVKGPGKAKNGGILVWLNGILGKPRIQSEPPDEERQYIFGFAGLWMMADEAHIINIAVSEEHQHQGIGELLLIGMIDLAAQLKARYIVLEVRVSNIVAQSLYSKYGFKAVGVRKGYYTDNHEDAVMMNTDDITTEAYRAKLNQLKKTHAVKWCVDSYEIEIRPKRTE
jgi:ribosomal-protein-alanine N-acetyltransferase